MYWQSHRQQKYWHSISNISKPLRFFLWQCQLSLFQVFCCSCFLIPITFCSCKQIFDKSQTKNADKQNLSLRGAACLRTSIFSLKKKKKAPTDPQHSIAKCMILMINYPVVLLGQLLLSHALGNLLKWRGGLVCGRLKHCKSVGRKLLLQIGFQVSTERSWTWNKFEA